MQNYISSKQGLTAAKIDQLMMDGLEQYFKHLKPHNRAVTIKLMYKWIPTNNFLHKQGWTDSPECPRCLIHKEYAEHIYQCPDTQASAECHDLLYEALEGLKQYGMPHPILHILEGQLSNLLLVESKHKYTLNDNAMGMSMSNQKSYTTAKHYWIEQLYTGLHIYSLDTTKQLYRDRHPRIQMARQAHSLDDITAPKNMGRMQYTCSWKKS